MIADGKLTILSANNVYGLVDMLQATLSRFMPSSSEEEIVGTAEVKQFFPGPRDFDGTLSHCERVSDCVVDTCVIVCGCCCRRGGGCYRHLWRAAT